MSLLLLFVDSRDGLARSRRKKRPLIDWVPFFSPEREYKRSQREEPKKLEAPPEPRAKPRSIIARMWDQLGPVKSDRVVESPEQISPAPVAPARAKAPAQVVEPATPRVVREIEELPKPAAKPAPLEIIGEDDPVLLLLFLE